MHHASTKLLSALGLIACSLLCSCYDGELPSPHNTDDPDDATGGFGGEPGTSGNQGGSDPAGGSGGDSAEPCIEGTMCAPGKVCVGDNNCVDGCFVDGQFYQPGDHDPNNPCQTCSDENPTGWTTRASGTPCADGRICDDGFACSAGCFVDGSFHSLGDINPSNECEVCSGSSTSDWSPVDEGAPCYGDRVCNAVGVCVDGCVIDGVQYVDGRMNPAGGCAVCDPGSSKTQWSPAAVGTKCDVGSYCGVDNECHSGCFIDGFHYEHGDVNPSNACETCTAANQTVWTGTLAVGAGCASGKICNAVFECVAGCFVGGICVEQGSSNSLNECEICDSDQSTIAWSSKPVGTSCGNGHLCDASGKCDWGCVVDGLFYEHGTVDSENECRICDAGLSADGWSARPQTTPCSDGGNYCNSAGQCDYGCNIDRVFYPAGTSSGLCEECNPGNDANWWSPKPAGTSCGPAAGDVCNGIGDCSLGCLIDGEFVVAGRLNQFNPCEECNPELAMLDWSPRAEGESCEANGPSDYCDGAGLCVRGCLIFGKLYADGTSEPGNTCRVCDSEQDPGDWTGVVGSVGKVCNGLSGGKYCFSDYECRDGCEIVMGIVPVSNIYEHGETNPKNECMYCNSENYWGWSSKPTGESCAGDGMICNSGSCMLGCFIDDEFVEPGTVNPEMDCQACYPEKSIEEWTDAAFGDPACNEPGSFCNADLVCIEGCYIDGTYSKHGDLNPDNYCQACTDKSATGWSDRFSLPYQQCDTGKYCNSRNVCSPGCWIGDEHREYGYRPGNSCQRCLSSSVYEWSLVGPVGAECNGSSALHCDASYNCVASCVVGNDVYLPGKQGNSCWVCDLTKPGQLTPAAEGDACSVDGGDTCDSVGNCVKNDTIKSISTGGFHTCIVTNKGAAKCWGGNSTGQLGNGTSGDSSSAAVDVSGLSANVAEIYAGGQHTCALMENGDAYCWGLNTSGQLGNGNITMQTKPVKVSTPMAFSSMAVGSYHTCAITVDNGVPYCWGRNTRGSVGDRTSVNRSTPTLLSNDGLNATCGSVQSGVIKMALGTDHTCAIRSNNAMYCWGDYTYGQLGGNLYGNNFRSYPTCVITNVGKVSAGTRHTCILSISGIAKCTGGGDLGQLGRGDTWDDNRFENVLVPYNGVEISVGWNHSCMLDTEGTVRCWGNNSLGQLARGSVGSYSTTQAPITGIPAGQKVSDLYPMLNGHACVMTDAGSAMCWGNNSDGQLGRGSSSPASSGTPALITVFP